jgi:hypothetical protein
LEVTKDFQPEEPKNMLGQVDQTRFLADIAGYLGFHYLTLALMNWGLAMRLRAANRNAATVSSQRRRFAGMALCLAFGLLSASLAAVAITGNPDWMQYITLPIWCRDLLDAMARPSVVLIGGTTALALLYRARRFFVRPAVAWTFLNAALLGLGLSLTDPDFAAIVGKPDNVAIVGLLLLLGFFTWLATAKAVENDRRLSNGLPPCEAIDNEKVLVWPDLVYIELICMVALTAFLLAWSLALRAPLEVPANLVATPNPSKAPWYFLGLQEMLVYFDPWMAGVVLPSLIIFGLLAIPYLDTDPQPSGYYTIRQRRFAYVTFQFGFLGLWITLIIIGTFFRGPNWNFFGVYETWDAHKTQPFDDVNLSQLFWVEWLGTTRPAVSGDMNSWTSWLSLLRRESPGLCLLGLYFFAIPAAATLLVRPLRELFQRLGTTRYIVLISLWLLMLMLPIKMFCRWSLNLKYFISLPELFFNL